jgi:methyl-accepting chemotaxis protein
MAGAVAALEAKTALLTIQRDLRQALLVEGAEKNAKAKESYDNAEKQFFAEVETLKKLLYLPAGKAKLDVLTKAYEDWTPTRTKALDLALKDEAEASEAVLFGDTNVKALAAVNAAVADLAKFKQDRASVVVKQQEKAGDQARKLMVGVIAAAIFIGFGVALVLARSITGAVARVAAAARQIAREDLPAFARAAQAMADGDLTQDVAVTTQRLSLKSKDELGNMAADFNQMVGGLQEVGTAFGLMVTNLRDMVGQTKEAAEALSSASQQLSQASQQTGAAVQQVTVAVQGIASGAQETSRSAQQTSTSVEQLSQAIDSITRGAGEQSRQVQAASATTSQMATGVEEVAINANNVAAASEQTRASAQHGAQAVRETVDGMGRIKSVVTQAAGKVEELGKLGERIGAVVETIDDIAEQTNLLALNAAIEAARAGEHGRGFAVVADEVRKLAERSQRETKAIADLIAQVQSGTREAVTAMEAGTVQVQEGAAKADQAGAALAQILAAAESTVTQVTGIAAAAQEMAAGARSVVAAMESISAVVEENTAATEEMGAQSESVSVAMQSIAAVSEENSAATEEVSASSEEMSATVQEMAARAEELAGTAAQLKGLVARFKLEAEGGSDQGGHIRRAA